MRPTRLVQLLLWGTVLGYTVMSVEGAERVRYRRDLVQIVESEGERDTKQLHANTKKHRGDQLLTQLWHVEAHPQQADAVSKDAAAGAPRASAQHRALMTMKSARNPKSVKAPTPSSPTAPSMEAPEIDEDMLTMMSMSLSMSMSMSMSFAYFM
jgi:hypothetical protein